MPCLGAVPAVRVTRARAIAAALLISIVLGACASDPSPLPFSIPSLVPAALRGDAVGVQQAVLTVPLVPRLGDRPDGPLLVEAPDSQPLRLDVGRQVVIAGDPQPGPDGPWVRVWVEPSITVEPGDFYAWLPTTQGGRATMAMVEPRPCPTEATIQTLAGLVQPDRLRCAGSTVLTIDARSGLLGLVPIYDVTPAWYGRNSDQGTTTLFDPGPARFGPDAKTSPELAGSWLEARLPPSVAPLPLGLFLRVTGRFDDPSAAGCSRSIAPGAVELGLPAEAPADSVQWCREQFVVSGWQVLLGAEGRPIDPLDPQLHRREFRLPQGAMLACGGVGMPPLTIRIDPRQVDPVWIDLPGGGHSMAMFAAEFHVRLDPPRVVSTTGVTLVDGEVLDPDKGKPGLSLCPGGTAVMFDVAPR